MLRVWDTLFFEGFKVQGPDPEQIWGMCSLALHVSQVFFRIAIGIFKRVEQEIMKCQSFDVAAQLQSIMDQG